MATAAQFAANQSNAQSSTGPRTSEGKARVSQNALRHGLTSRHLVIRPDEQDEFNALQNSLLEELNPQGALEGVTFQELIHAAWTLHRLRRVEAETCTGAMSDFMDPAVTAILDRLSRYQSRAQRAYYKALAEFRILQTNRAVRQAQLTEEAPAVSPAASKTPAAADINRLTKQTQSEAKTGTTATPPAGRNSNPVRVLADVLRKAVAGTQKSAA